jgi:F-type H+-transporting ATPase subunit epsilon
MEPTFKLEIYTPERKFYSGDVEMVVFKAPDGEMGIMAGHAPMVAAVAIGTIRILKDGEWLQAVLTEGFIEVKQSIAVILTDTAEWPNEIDINRAKAAKDRAGERLSHQLGQIEYMRSQAALTRALARLKVTKMK